MKWSSATLVLVSSLAALSVADDDARTYPKCRPKKSSLGYGHSSVSHTYGYSTYPTTVSSVDPVYQTTSATVSATNIATTPTTTSATTSATTPTTTSATTSTTTSTTTSSTTSATTSATTSITTSTTTSTSSTTCPSTTCTDQSTVTTTSTVTPADTTVTTTSTVLSTTTLPQQTVTSTLSVGSTSTLTVTVIASPVTTTSVITTSTTTTSTATFYTNSLTSFTPVQSSLPSSGVSNRKRSLDVDRLAAIAPKCSCIPQPVKTTTSTVVNPASTATQIETTTIVSTSTPLAATTTMIVSFSTTVTTTTEFTSTETVSSTITETTIINTSTSIPDACSPDNMANTVRVDGQIKFLTGAQFAGNVITVSSTSPLDCCIRAFSVTQESLFWQYYGSCLIGVSSGCRGNVPLDTANQAQSFIADASSSNTGSFIGNAYCGKFTSVEVDES